jgi:hypothetical protein
MLRIGAMRIETLPVRDQRNRLALRGHRKCVSQGTAKVVVAIAPSRNED